ncbi:cytochrome P450 [Nemania sp. FL0916]|nr:cytochrome P450 [Nemania sp. FL0916]
MRDLNAIPQMPLVLWTGLPLWVVLPFTLWCAYTITRCIYLLYFHPAAKFPGPKLAAISNIPYAYHWLRGRWPWAVEEMVKQYGDIVRVAPNEIVFTTTQAALGNSYLHKTFALTRAKWYSDIYNPAVKNHEIWLKTDLMDFGTGDLGFIWEQDPVKRREVAKKVFPAFSSKAIKAKEPTVQQHIDLFITKMKAIGSDPGGVSLNTWLFWLAMDMSADLAYSRDLHQMQEETSSDFMETLLGTNFFATIMQVSKKLPFLTPLAYLVVPLSIIKKLGKTFKMNSEAVQRRIDNHGNTKHPDFMDHMVPDNSPVPIPEKLKIHIEQVALQMFIAGFDPIQLVYFSSLFFLMKEPEVLRTLMQEIRSEFSSYDEITPDALANLPYLNACIHETMRIHVPTATGMPRKSPGAVVDGNYIPKGVVCQTSFFTITRNPRNFHDPLRFCPARWLPADHPQYESKFARDKLKSYFPFGVGPRACTGRKIAWSQCRLFLGKVLWTFDLEQTLGQSATFDKDYSTHVMWYKPEIRIRFIQR